MSLVWVLLVLEYAYKLYRAFLANGNIREFFRWREKFWVFKREFSVALTPTLILTITLTLLTHIGTVIVNKATIFASTNDTTSTRQQLQFLSSDCFIISYIGRPDNENHYADDRPNNHYHLRFDLKFCPWRFEIWLWDLIQDLRFARVQTTDV